jgi:hypothetical protein
MIDQVIFDFAFPNSSSFHLDLIISIHARIINIIAIADIATSINQTISQLSVFQKL